jgi:sulfite reductase (ferredoxin)
VRSALYGGTGLCGNDTGKHLEPLFAYFKAARTHNGKPESFGDFCHRIGFTALREYVATYVPTSSKSNSEKHRIRHRVNLRPTVFENLKLAAQNEGRTLAEIASDAIEAYLQKS